MLADRFRILELCAVDFTMRQFIAPLAQYLADRGCDVHCACAEGPYFPELKERGLQMVAMPMERRASPVAQLKATIALVRWIAKHKPDVVHVHTPVASLAGRLAAWVCRVPIIIYTAHGFYFHEGTPRGQRRFHIALEWLFGQINDALFCVSEEDVATARALGITRGGMIEWVGNGVDSRRFDPARPELVAARQRIRAELGIPEHAQVVTIMGRLVREKGFREFFTAARELARRHDGLHFIVAGDTVTGEHDGAKEEIAALARVPELEGLVHFTGMRDDVPELLAATDIFTLPSYREGLPTSVIEAMMMERPVVATRIRGCREAVQDGQTGFLVEPANASELTGALDYLLRNPSAGSMMGRSGRVRACARFDQTNVLRRQWLLLRQLAVLAD